MDLTQAIYPNSAVPANRKIEPLELSSLFDFSRYRNAIREALDLVGLVVFLAALCLVRG